MKELQAKILPNSLVWVVGICAVITCAPWFSGSQEPIGLLLGSAALATGLFLLWRQPRVRTYRIDPLGWAYIAFVGWGILSLIWTANRYSTWLWILPLLLAGLVFRLTYSLAREPQGRRILSWLYLVTASLFGAFGIWLYLTSGYERLTSSLYWANPAAAYLLPAVLISLDMAVRAKTRKWLYIALNIFLLTCFILTDSRAAGLILGIVLLIYLFIIKPSKRLWIQIVFTLLAAFMLSIGAVQLRQNLQPQAAISVPSARLTEATNGESKSANDRLLYLESTLNIWQKYPVAGSGAGTFGDLHPSFQQRVISASSNVHNYFVQTLAELGLIGFVLLLGVVIAGLLAIARGALQTDGVGVYVLALLGLALHAGVDIDFSYPALILFFAYLLGLIAGQRQIEARKLSVSAPLLALLYLCLIAVLYQADATAQRAKAYQEAEDFLTAATMYDQAGKWQLADPDWVSAAGINYFTLASGGVDRQINLDTALARARTAQDLDPYDAQHYQLEARVLAATGDLKGATTALKRALELDSLNHPEYALDLAQVYVYQGDTGTAIQTAKAMLLLYPDDILANRAADQQLHITLANLAALIGNVYAQQGNYTQAQVYATLALHYNPQSTRGRALQNQLTKLTANR